MSERIRVLIAGHTYVVAANQGKLEALAALGVEVGILVPERWRDRMISREFCFEHGAGSFQAFPARVPFAGRGGAYVFPPRVIRQAVR
jgi:hypothetical protein